MRIRKNVSLKDLNTFRLGGRARYFTEIKSAQELPQVFDFVGLKQIPFFVLGAGSNVLISDFGFPGLILRLKIKGLVWRDREKTVEVTAAAGEIWDDLVKQAVSRNLFGLENLSGIPGTVGGAAVQNIGAYGAEIKEILRWLEVFNPETKKFSFLTGRQCRLSYRGSVFKQPAGQKLVITRVCFRLRKNGRPNLSYGDLQNRFAGRQPTLRQVRRAVLSIRRRKFPDLNQYGTAGSFFKNPLVSKTTLTKLLKKFPGLPCFPFAQNQTKISLAWLLDRGLGLKGRVFDNVELFKNQPLVVVNRGQARASEIKMVTDYLAQLVRKKTGIVLEREVVFLGKF